VTTAVDAMELAVAERADLVALLESLSSAQWDAPTLCSRWAVRDVVAHVFGFDELDPLGLAGLLLRSGLRPGRANDLRVTAHAGDGPDELLALARAHLRPRGLTAGFGGRIALTDGLIHQQDIRRPLGLPREIPTDRLRTALRFASTARPIGAARRIRGLTLTATDLDWTTGEGLLVEGPGESLVLAMAGRRGVVGELSGPGQPVLTSRIEP
jgi:uncharacterized protein (TIGR03083 family)